MSLAHALPWILACKPHGTDAIWTIVDRLSKQAHFLPIPKTIKPGHMVHIFHVQVLKTMENPSLLSEIETRGRPACSELQIFIITYVGNS